MNNLSHPERVAHAVLPHYMVRAIRSVPADHDFPLHAASLMRCPHRRTSPIMGHPTWPDPPLDRSFWAAACPRKANLSQAIGSRGAKALSWDGPHPVIFTIDERVRRVLAVRRNL